MSAASILFLALAAVGALYYILSTAALIRHFRKAASSRLSPAKRNILKVSILKPVRGIDSRASENFISFMDQDYTDYEVLFGVLDENDPSVEILQDITAGKLHASIYTGSSIDGFNNKVRILHTLFERSVGDIIAIADADTRATPDFIDRLIASFDEPNVGMVTCMYKGINDHGIADMLEALHMTCVFAPGVASANAMGKIDFGLGASMAVRREVIEKIGGFETIANYLADDFQLGRKTTQVGYDVALSDYVIDINLSGEKIAHVMQRELRWSVTTRVSRPAGHFGLIFTFGFAYALMFAASVGFGLLGWSILIGVSIIRLATAYIGSVVCLGDNHFLKRAWLIPVRDLLSFAIWVAGYFKRSVTWRDRKLVLAKDGRITRVK